jgi:hypothetical protein
VTPQEEQGAFLPAGVRDRDRFLAAIRAIDARNAEDPRRIDAAAGPEPFELAYARRLTHWVAVLAPGASEALALAARGQHIARWEIPRDRFPKGLKGYLQWREGLKQFHADNLASILAGCGYADDEIAAVRALVTKEKLEDGDPDSQVIEDALCLVFLELQLAGVMAEHPREKVLDIVAKTWRKMSEAGRREALKLKLGDAAGSVVREAAGG